MVKYCSAIKPGTANVMAMRRVQVIENCGVCPTDQDAYNFPNTSIVSYVVVVSENSSFALSTRLRWGVIGSNVATISYTSHILIGSTCIFSLFWCQ